jgi:hypothetical protein
VQVNLTEVRDNLKSNFAFLDSINENWIKISKYVFLQKKWKLFYVNYSLFVLNQKLRQKDIEKMESEFAGETLKKGPIYL